MQNTRYLFVVLAILFAIFVVWCACALWVGAISIAALGLQDSPVSSTPTPYPTLVSPAPSTLTVEPEIPPLTSQFTETLTTLEKMIVPINDRIDLARRLKGIEDAPSSLKTPVKIYREGDQGSFWVNNSDTNEYFQVEATLGYITDHVYFWVQNGEEYNRRDMKALVDTFEEKIYPTNREFFGSEWTPGVDADPHLFILYLRGLGKTVAGYFSSADEYLPIIYPYSNAHEMFMLSMDGNGLKNEYTYSILAHEFQHMIHWNGDRNEEIWLNEGMSDLAVFINGYSEGGHDRVFALAPDIQLNEWPNGEISTANHYGASFLFMTYFLDRFGEQATKALVANPENGLMSMDVVLRQLGVRDPLTGNQVDTDSFFLDWLITNYLQDDEVADGRYDYNNYPGAPDFGPTQEITHCPTEALSNTVRQYGVNYISIRCKGDFTINFSAPETVRILPTDAHSGRYTFFSNRGDESDMTLTREFDFTGVTEPLTLSYWTWYDLEKNYDFLYLVASEDGERWEILNTPGGSADNSTGNNYGWGYTGKSDGQGDWTLQEVDLSQYAGKKVLIRFEYITDEAANGEGFWLDDIALVETGYSTDFEEDDGGWAAGGFVRIENVLPQTYQLALIELGRDDSVKIIPIPADNHVKIPISIGKEVREAVLVVSGTSRFTRQPAVYSLKIEAR